jgi:hypothetical protein
MSKHLQKDHIHPAISPTRKYSVRPTESLLDYLKVGWSPKPLFLFVLPSPGRAIGPIPIFLSRPLPAIGDR